MKSILKIIAVDMLSHNFEEQAQQILGKKKFHKRDRLSSIAVAGIHKLLDNYPVLSLLIKTVPIAVISISESHSTITNQFLDELQEFGLEGTSPRLFTYSTPNITSFSIIQEFDLKGFGFNISGGVTSGWNALELVNIILKSNRAKLVLISTVEDQNKAVIKNRSYFNYYQGHTQGRGSSIMVLSSTNDFEELNAKLHINDFIIKYDRTRLHQDWIKPIKKSTITIRKEILKFLLDKNQLNLKGEIKIIQPTNTIPMKTPATEVSSLALSLQIIEAKDFLEKNIENRALILEVGSGGFSAGLGLNSIS